ncbi:MAG: DUF2092 domain-containing protein [Candidatus Omnitrophica bacterium]|nr:Thiol-disulfide oxidoreductase ResA [bacterium]NUN95204.1 DUF2092 domain-containing protein [Candidatus Omnitrophota bacterium]
MRRVIAVSVILAIGGPAFGQLPQPVIDPQAEGILRKMSALFQGARSLRYSSTGTVSVVSKTLQKDTVTRTTVSARRPNLVRFDVRRGNVAVDNISDGSTMFSYVPPLNAYLKRPSLPNLEGLVTKYLATQAAVIDDSRFAYFPLMEDPYAASIRGASKVTYLGQETLDGVACDRIRFAKLPSNVDVWFEAGDRPFPRQFVPDTSMMAKRLALGMKMPDLSLTATVQLHGWELDSALADDLFRFTPPADAVEKESFKEMAQPHQPTELIGKAAPAFKAALHSGGEFNLEDHRGRNVVVLDFWATWCGPCVMALPLIAEVAKEYRNKGVVFVAVNQGDSPETISAFLEKRPVDITIAVDEEGRAGMQYYVSGIPQSVIIGRDGKVANVHVGLAPNIQEILRAELDGLLGGGTPPAEAVTSGSGAAQPPR